MESRSPFGTLRVESSFNRERQQSTLQVYIGKTKLPPLKFYEGISSLAPWRSSGESLPQTVGFTAELCYSIGSNRRFLVYALQDRRHLSKVADLDVFDGFHHPVEWADLDLDGCLELLCYTDPRFSTTKLNSSKPVWCIYRWNQNSFRFILVGERAIKDRFRFSPPTAPVISWLSCQINRTDAGSFKKRYGNYARFRGMHPQSGRAWKLSDGTQLSIDGFSSAKSGETIIEWIEIEAWPGFLAESVVASPSLAPTHKITSEFLIRSTSFGFGP